MIRCAFVVRGRVQGVGYRWFAQRSAQARGVAGSVHNEPDGSVCGEVEGEAAAVQAFVDDLRRGPLGARVDDVATTPRSPIGQRGFTIAR